jgi:hypothetical protein
LYFAINGRFYAANGDDNFIVTEAQADNCHLIHIDDGMGDQWNLAALTYSLFVGDCDGHSTGGCHGAGERDPEVVDFDSGIVLVSECVLTESVITHKVREKTRFYSRNHTKNYFCLFLPAS